MLGTGRPQRDPDAPAITSKTPCVDPNQLHEGNALKGFNEECDTYYSADAASPGGVRAFTDLLDEDDSKVIRTCFAPSASGHSH